MCVCVCVCVLGWAGLKELHQPRAVNYSEGGGKAELTQEVSYHHQLAMIAERGRIRARSGPGVSQRGFGANR